MPQLLLESIQPTTAIQEVASQAFNAVLFLGPLIHLTERAERTKALAELGRVLEPGGVASLAASGIQGYPVLYQLAGDWYGDVVVGPVSGVTDRIPVG